MKDMHPAKNKLLPGYFLCAAAILLTTCILYSPSRHYDFLLWDDPTYILNDPATQHLSVESIVTAFTSIRNSVWYPLARISHTVDMTLFGRDATQHRTVNIFLHAINAFLLFCIYMKLSSYHLTKKKENIPSSLYFYSCLVSSIIFTIHPQNVEVVVWISQRKEILSTFLSLIAIFSYCNYKLNNTHKTLWIICSFLSSALAMLAKPMAVSIPFLLIALDIFIFDCEKKDLLQSFIKKIPFFALSTAVASVVIYTHEIHTPENLNDYYSLPLRISYAAYNYGSTFLNFFLPLQLSPIKQIPDFILNDTAISYTPLITLLLSIALLALFIKRGNNIASFCISWFLIAYMPVSGINMFGTYSPGDRYAYFSTLPFFIVFTFTLYSLCLQLIKKTIYHRFLYPVIVIFNLLYSSWIFSITKQQIEIWKDDTSLWGYVTSNYPENGTSRMIFSMALYVQGDYVNSIDQCSKALKIGPVFKYYPTFECYELMFSSLFKLGHFSEAADQLVPHLQQRPHDTRVMNLFAYSLVLSGQIEKGLNTYKHAFNIDQQITLFLLKEHADSLEKSGLTVTAKKMRSLYQDLLSNKNTQRD